MKQETFFNEGAQARLKVLFPVEGERRYDELEQFFSIVREFPNEEFVVPAELDPVLHEVLSARDANGNGFEKYKVSHETRPSLGAIGKTFESLQDPVSQRTQTLLRQKAYTFSDQTYAMHACTVRIVN